MCDFLEIDPFGTRDIQPPCGQGSLCAPLRTILHTITPRRCTHFIEPFLVAPEILPRTVEDASLEAQKCDRVAWCEVLQSVQCDDAPDRLYLSLVGLAA